MEHEKLIRASCAKRIISFIANVITFCSFSFGRSVLRSLARSLGDSSTHLAAGTRGIISNAYTLGICGSIEARLSDPKLIPDLGLSEMSFPRSVFFSVRSKCHEVWEEKSEREKDKWETRSERDGEWERNAVREKLSEREWPSRVSPLFFPSEVTERLSVDWTGTVHLSGFQSIFHTDSVDYLFCATWLNYSNFFYVQSLSAYQFGWRVLFTFVARNDVRNNEHLMCNTFQGLALASCGAYRFMVTHFIDIKWIEIVFVGFFFCFVLLLRPKRAQVKTHYTRKTLFCDNFALSLATSRRILRMRIFIFHRFVDNPGSIYLCSKRSTSAEIVECFFIFNGLVHFAPWRWACSTSLWCLWTV